MSAAKAQQTHSVSVIKTNQLMLYRKIIAVSSEIHTKHINAFCKQKVKFLISSLVAQEVATGR
jgi:hypothetical protein